MFYIDDVIESALCMAPREETCQHPNRPHSSLNNLVELLTVELENYGQLISGVDARAAIATYLERWPDRAEFDDQGNVVYIGDTIWSPARLCYIPLFVPPMAGRTIATDTNVQGAPAPEAKPAEPAQPAREIDPNDQLPHYIEKPTEAWAWWLQQPGKIGKYWKAKDIINGILDVSTRFNRHKLKGSAIAMAPCIERHSWPISIQTKGRVNTYGVGDRTAPFNVSMSGASEAVVSESAPPSHEPVPGTTEPAPVAAVGYQVPKDPVEAEYHRICRRKLLTPYNEETEEEEVYSEEPDLTRPEVLKLWIPEQFKDYVPPGRVSVNTPELWDSVAQFIVSHLKYHCFRKGDFIWYLHAIIEFTGVSILHYIEQRDIIFGQLFELGWAEGEFEACPGIVYVGPKEMIKNGILHDHAGYMAFIDKWKDR